jgi:hypothetical protein
LVYFFPFWYVVIWQPCPFVKVEQKFRFNEE